MTRRLTGSKGRCVVVHSDDSGCEIGVGDYMSWGGGDRM